MNNQGQPPVQQQQQNVPPVANQQNIRQAQADIGQAANTTPGTLASYETVPPDDGVGNDVGEYKPLKIANFE